MEEGEELNGKMWRRVEIAEESGKRSGRRWRESGGRWREIVGSWRVSLEKWRKVER